MITRPGQAWTTRELPCVLSNSPLQGRTLALVGGAQGAEVEAPAAHVVGLDDDLVDWMQEAALLLV